MLSIFFELTSPRTQAPQTLLLEKGVFLPRLDEAFIHRGSFYPDWMKNHPGRMILPRLDDSLSRLDECQNPKKGVLL